MSYLAPIVEVGGDGGYYFDFRGTADGGVLEKIGVWAGEWQIRGIKIWLTNGQSQLIGKNDERYSEFKFYPGERITSLSLWDNTRAANKLRLGAIKFETNRGRTYFPKMKWSLKKEQEVDVGSGICMGVTGRANLDLDRLGFLFINPIQSTVLTNMSYPTLLELLPQVVMEEIKSTTFKNETTLEQSFTLENSRKITKTSSWSVANKVESTFSMTVKAGIPEVVGAESGFSFTVGSESSYNLENSIEYEEKVSVPVIVPPGKTVDGVASIGHADVDVPYEATVRVTCTNRSVLEFNMSGIYNGVTYTSIFVHLQEHDRKLE